MKSLTYSEPEVDLQGLVDVGQRHAQLLGLHAVDVGEQLRHVDLEAGEHAGETGLSVHGLGLHRLHGLVQLVVAHVAAVFEHQLEAAVVPRPFTGGGDSTMIKASWMEPRRLLIFGAIDVGRLAVPCPCAGRTV